MNVFLQSPEERIRSWRDFRKRIANLDEATQMNEIVEFWKQAPLVRFAFDWTQPSEFLTPWEMLTDGVFCRNGLAYMMGQTLHHLDSKKWTNATLELIMVKVKDPEDQYIVLVATGETDTWVLNYEHGVVMPWNAVKDQCALMEIIPLPLR